MKTQVINRNLIVSIFAVMLFVYGSQSISYGQVDAPTVTPGETITSLVVRFQITLDEGVDENAYQIQLRRKTPTGEWISKCVVIKHGSRSEIAGDPDVSAWAKYIAQAWPFSGYYLDDTFNIKAIFTDLEPGITYEARHRDTNLPECAQNPPAPDPWSDIVEGTTHLTNPSVDFVDANLAKRVRDTLKLDTKGEHIVLLKIPEAALVKLTELNLHQARITDLTGLEHATQLTDLSATYNDISDVTPLAQLSQLTYLNLSHNNISDVTPLAQLPQLVELNLSHNDISDVTPLLGLKSLKKLYLEGNPIWHQDTDPLIAYLDANPDVDLDIAKLLIRDEGGPTIYWAEEIDNHSYIIRRMDLANGRHQDVVTLSESPGDIAIDTSGGKIYWSSRTTIKRANLDGTDIQLVTGAFESVRIYLDVSGGKIYWLSQEQNKIQRADLDGADVEDIITGLSDDPLDLAVDVSGGKVYWTYRYGQIYIRRADLDGANVEDLITRTERAEPTDIDLDVSAGKMYWRVGRTGKIQRANLDGTKIKNIVSGVGYGDIALDVSGGKIYWSHGSRIRRADLDGANVEDVVTGLTGLRGIALTTSTSGNEFSSTTPETSATTDAVVSISPASVASPAVGAQLEVRLNITDGESVAGYQTTVQFDETALGYVSGANGDFLPAGAFFVDPKVEGNLVKLNAASLAGESNGDGILATLTFEVVAAKASTLMLSDVLLTNSAGETFVPRIENGEITESTGLKGDVNADGTVNIADLVLVAGALGETGQNAADVNDDGIVNIADLVLVAGALGTSAAAPALHPNTLEMLTATEVKQWLSAAQQLGITDATSQRGILFLQQLLTTLTPKQTALLANYPNPFNPETWIPYHLAKDADVTLHIYAVNGTLVRMLSLGHQTAGMYQNHSRAAYWDGKNAFGEKVASGVYFYTLTAGDFSATRKMLIRK
ncbi:leucine-rich repeat domain-containing protein [Candidatus Poribacteria bacterium]|nr:leucine-rich repeat domain-containing protein [Candidatus Poribacteria bacterium]